MPSDRVLAARRKSILTRHRPADDPELLEVSRDHAAMLLEEYVAKIVSSAPPFTESQRARISALLAPAADVAA
jgi:hypothetical protein